jgi:hypothetical protein
MKNGRRKADLSPVAAIYAAQTEAVQPPDDRTYSAEVTVFRRNLLHHRSAMCRLRPHTLDHFNTHGAVCQLFFDDKSQKYYDNFGANVEIF